MPQKIGRGGHDVWKFGCSELVYFSFQPFLSTLHFAPCFQLELGVKFSPLSLQSGPLLCIAWVNSLPCVTDFRINPSRGFIMFQIGLKSVDRFSTTLPFQEGTDAAPRYCCSWSDFPFSVLFSEHLTLPSISLL